MPIRAHPADAIRAGAALTGGSAAGGIDTDGKQRRTQGLISFRELVEHIREMDDLGIRADDVEGEPAALATHDWLVAQMQMELNLGRASLECVESTTPGLWDVKKYLREARSAPARVRARVTGF